MRSGCLFQLELVETLHTQLVRDAHSSKVDKTRTAEETRDPITKILLFAMLLPGLLCESLAQSLDTSVQSNLLCDVALDRWYVSPGFALRCLDPFTELGLARVVDNVQ